MNELKRIQIPEHISINIYFINILTYLDFYWFICVGASNGDILGEEARVQLPEARNVPDQYWECFKILSCHYQWEKHKSMTQTRVKRTTGRMYTMLFIWLYLVEDIMKMPQWGRQSWWGKGYWTGVDLRRRRGAWKLNWWTRLKTSLIRAFLAVVHQRISI